MKTRIAKSAKIAISLPRKLLRGVEKTRRTRGETRSEFFRRAVEDFLRRGQEHELDEQYVRGYRRLPETEEEISVAESTARRAWAENPWKEDNK